MNISPPPPGKPPPSRRSRFLRRSAFGVAALLTLIAVFYAVEDWRGRRAWEQCKRELKAKGEQLDWATYVPAQVPDEQNFIKTPLLQAVGYSGQTATKAGHSLEEAKQHLVWEAWVDPQTGRKMDWARCQAVLRSRSGLDLPPLPQEPAADLLHALETIEPQLAELRAASLKPLAQFDVDRTAPFEESRDVNFVAVRSLSQILAFHACAELALQHSDQAFADVRVILRFSESLKGENTLVALMIRVALQGLALEPFWEGWAEGRWSERELLAFQERFGQVDLLPEYTRVMRAERAGITALVEKYGIQRNELGRVATRNDSISRGWWGAVCQQTLKWAWKLVPRGWVYQNLVTYNQRIQRFIPATVESRPATVSPAQVEEFKARLPREITGGVYDQMSRMAIPNLGKALEKLSRIQNLVNQARIVCALERCRKARSQYPESLAELVPQFIEQLPVDLINGGPMQYRRTNDGKFLLYSVGWNEVDDGGTPGVTRDPSAKPDFTWGDWVWQYPVE